MDTLNKIIKACFEGFFGTMIGGLVIYSIQSMRKNRRILLVIWLLLIGMGAWRFFMTNFYSPRYAAIFLFPAILFTAFMMVKFKKWWWVLLIVFGIICCCKIVRNSPGGAVFTESASLIKADAAGRGAALIYSYDNNWRRTKFYTGIKSLALPRFQSAEKLPEQLSQVIKIASRSADVMYFCLEFPGNKTIAQDDLEGAGGEWILLYKVLKNRKKNVHFYVYRYQKPGTVDKKTDLKK